MKQRLTGNQMFETGEQWIELYRSPGGIRQGYWWESSYSKICLWSLVSKTVYWRKSQWERTTTMQKDYLQKSNKRNATRDVLQQEVQHWICFAQPGKRKKRKHTERKSTQKKRPRPTMSDEKNDNGSETASSSSAGSLKGYSQRAAEWNPKSSFYLFCSKWKARNEWATLYRQSKWNLLLAWILPLYALMLMLTIINCDNITCTTFSQYSNV